MKSEYIAIIDSGVGGISTLIKMQKAFPNENYIYLGDNENAPYGNKSKRKLLSLMINNLIILNNYKIKYIVIGCNTMSLMIRKEIEEFTNKKVFCVFPPVERELVNSHRTLLLSTYNTAKKYNYKNLDAIGFYSLAEDIENNINNLHNISLNKNIENSYKKLSNNPLKTVYDTLILGCTHYEFIKNQIFNHFRVKNMLSGNDCTLFYISKIYKPRKTIVKHKRYRLLFLGKSATKNYNFYSKVVKDMQK